MLYTQVELTSPGGNKEVWWLPVPEKHAKVGEKITRGSVDWNITQVCVTLEEKDIPQVFIEKDRVAKNFRRQAETLAYMSI